MIGSSRRKLTDVIVAKVRIPSLENLVVVLAVEDEAVGRARHFILFHRNFAFVDIDGHLESIGGSDDLSARCLVGRVAHGKE